MATVIHLKRPQSFGSGLGEGIAKAMARQLDEEKKKEEAKRISDHITRLRNARTPQEAGDIYAAIVNSDLVKDKQDIASLTGVYQTVRKDLEPVEVQGVDADNRPATRLVPKSQYDQMAHDPKLSESVLGIGFKAGARPEQEAEFFFPPDERNQTFTTAGRAPISKKVPGSMSEQEVTFAFQQANQQRAAEDQQFQRASAIRAGEREERAVQASQRQARNQEGDNIRADVNQMLTHGKTVYGRQLDSGIFTIDDEDKRATFNKVSGRAEKYIRQQRMSPLEAWAKAQAEVDPKFGQKEETPVKPPAKAEEKKPGIIDRFKKELKDRGYMKGDDNDEKSKVEAAGWKYEPGKYEYRIGPDGKVQRRPK